MVSCHLCVLVKRPDPSSGDVFRWSLPYSERCHCQGVVAPRKFTKTCFGYKDVTSDIKLWFVDDSAPLTKHMNWNKETLDILLERKEYCATCENDWELFGNYCYQATSSDISFDAAEDACQKQGGHLASIHSQGEQKFIEDLYNIADNYWIGLTDALNEGTFVWTDDSTVDYKNWGSRQPGDQATEQDCVMALHQSSGLWHDVPFDYSQQFGNMAYVCKKEAVQNSTINSTA
ncbi:type-2 ice-structuring protein-like [Amphiura filiformis]|uniref:type-2 ice-structuring protein-like n=1 Tax=Amphiura filiformis TaxID=82378 RepID=UPI003B212DCE